MNVCCGVVLFALCMLFGVVPLLIMRVDALMSADLDTRDSNS